MYDLAWDFYDNEVYNKAYDLFLQLAQDKNVIAQKTIANMLLLGTGTKKDIDRAYYWYHIAADNKDAESQYIYGWYCIEQGNEEQGIQYIQQAASSNYIDALFDLAGFNLFGMHTCEKNLSVASQLYEKSFLLGKEDSFESFIHTKIDEVGKFKALIYFFKNFFHYLRVLKRD